MANDDGLIKKFVRMLLKPGLSVRMAEADRATSMGMIYKPVVPVNPAGTQEAVNKLSEKPDSRQLLQRAIRLYQKDDFDGARKAFKDLQHMGGSRYQDRIGFFIDKIDMEQEAYRKRGLVK